MNKKKPNFTSFWRDFKAVLTESPSTDTVFNQYLDCNDLVDLPDAATIRLENLRQYMEDATKTASVLIVGEAPGPWGCRFSGVPFTSERQFQDSSFPVRGKRSSRDILGLLTKKAPPFTSISAEIFWGLMLPYQGRFLLWNAFPFHPHQSHDILTVRTPTRREVLPYAKALQLIKAYVEPARTVALGKTSFNALARLGEASHYVRHPAMGGKKAFIAGMQKVFGNDGVSS